MLLQGLHRVGYILGCIKEETDDTLGIRSILYFCFAMKVIVSFMEKNRHFKNRKEIGTTQTEFELFYIKFFLITLCGHILEFA